MLDSKSPAPIRKIVRIEAKPGLADQARAALLDLERATRAEAGCQAFIFFQALGDACAFLLVEEFADQTALDAHMGLPHTQAFFAKNLLASVKPVDPRWLQ